MYRQYLTGCGHIILYIPSTDSPKVLSFTPTNTTVVAGSNVTLNCSYEGNPSPTVSWSHNETMLDISDPNLSEILNDGYALLAVTFADINDTGSYGCGLQNIIDISNSEFFFHTVQGTYNRLYCIQCLYMYMYTYFMYITVHVYLYMYMYIYYLQCKINAHTMYIVHCMCTYRRSGNIHR